MTATVEPYLDFQSERGKKFKAGVEAYQTLMNRKAEREGLYLDLYELCANVDADLEAGYHLIDNQGLPLIHFDEWLLAATEGRYE